MLQVVGFLQQWPQHWEDVKKAALCTRKDADIAMQRTPLTLFVTPAIRVIVRTMLCDGQTMLATSHAAQESW
jgi:hypothetical protein